MAEEAAGVSGLAGRYATALFELAEEQGQLDDVARDLTTLRAMLNDSDDLQRLVKSPVIARDDQVKALSAVAERAALSALVRNFLGLLARNRRLFAVADMIAAFGALLAAHRGEVTAQVSSAQALSDAQMASLNASLKSAIGRDVRIEADVDSSLLGGLVVRIGSRMIDNSLKAKLQGLRLALKGIG